MAQDTVNHKRKTQTQSSLSSQDPTEGRRSVPVYDPVDDQTRPHRKKYDLDKVNFGNEGTDSAQEPAEGSNDIPQR